MADFLMPSLGADMDSGVVLEWRVEPGDRVKRGDIVAVVDTSKAEIEIEVFDDGVVEQLLVPVGTRVEVGTPIARLATEDAPAATVGNGAAVAITAEPVPAEPAERRRVSPVARRTATLLGVDLDAVEGTGPKGAIVRADVERAAGAVTAAPAPAPPPPPPAPPAAREDGRAEAMRSAIAQLMSRSKREVPHYYLREDLDMSAALAFLERRNAELPVARRLLPAVLLLKATALAVAEVPELNGFWTGERFEPARGVHLGLAVSLRGGGLVAPAIHDTDTQSLDELMAAMRDLVKRGRAGTLRSSEVSDPTLTVTNLGERGAQEVYGVIYPPQVALVGFGRIGERPWAVDGMLAVRPVTTATLSGDHRASDGATGSRLLAAVARHLREPEGL